MEKPNVVYILADDLGIGDISCYNDKSKIQTPNIDKIAKNGIQFTDAHAPSAVCTPSRYGILTGRYCWRSELKSSVLWPWDKALIEKNRMTLGNIYQQSGYDTMFIGKWHLGWNWKTKDGKIAGDSLELGKGCEDKRLKMGEQINYTAEIDGGPSTRGFEHYIGIDVPNFPPYAWFVDNKLENIPLKDYDFKQSDYEDKDELHAGRGIEKYNLEDVSVRLSQEAVKYIEERDKNPFFLFYSLTGPHTPIVPTKEFIGKSEAGLYGDYVCMMDWAVGEVVNALEKKGILDNTIIIFTSDNGPENFAYERIRAYNHYSMHHYRGVKRDLWEGGHRVPMVLQWPNKIKSREVCDEVISLLDFFATSEELLQISKEKRILNDSISFTHLLGEERSKDLREGIIYHSCSGKFSIRIGDWVYIDAPSGDDNKEPDWFKEERGYCKNYKEKELYNLKNDIGQKINLFGLYPEKEKYMCSLLYEYIQGNYSVEYSKN